MAGVVKEHPSLEQVCVGGAIVGHKTKLTVHF